MNVADRKKMLLPMSKEEKIYRQLYYSLPQVYFYDQMGAYFEDWSSFLTLYGQHFHPNVSLPKEAPTLMSNTLLEQTFFGNTNRDVCIVMNARYCPPFWHHLNFIKIMYVLNGEFLFNISGKERIILRQGNFILVPPNMKQSVFSYHDDDMIVNIFLKTSTFAQTFASLLQESNELAPFFWKVMYGKDESSLIWFHTDPDKQLDEIICHMLDEWEKPQTGGNFYLIGNVMAFLAHALYYHRNEVSFVLNAQMQKNAFPEVIQYIYDHYNTLTLPELAEHFGRSEGYMSRYIKQETGYALSRLLKDFKMKQAGKMIRDTRFSISQIMYDVGYTDISYFYRAFKEYYGMTPLEFRGKDKVIML